MLKLVLSCEHASNLVPAPYAALFAGNTEVLHTHRGYDPGTELLTRTLAPLADCVHIAEVSRLLIEINRSERHPNLFSEFSNQLPTEQKMALIAQYYIPHRHKVEQCIQSLIQQGHTVVHISVHSFTPNFYGEVRNADIGLLYDPKRIYEKPFCAVWKQQLRRLIPEWNTRFNYPYLGTADGFTTYLRKRLPATHYLGIELETSQSLWQEPEGKVQEHSRAMLYQSLAACLQHFQQLL